MSVAELKFGVFTDVHLDIVHDGDKRLAEFYAEANREDVDFLMCVGDFSYPEDTSRCDCPWERMPINLQNAQLQPTKVPKIELVQQYHRFPKPTFHTLGNHDLDFCEKSAAVELYKMPHTYYSFRNKGWNFIVLDTNFFIDDETGAMRDYSYGNYFGHTRGAYLPQEQLTWLQQELQAHTCPTLIFSHQPFIDRQRSVDNADQFFELIKQHPHVKLCINGHTHIDQLIRHNGVWFLTINSMSNFWVGEEYMRKRYSEEIEEQFPNLKYTIPYKDSLYTFITLTSKGAQIKEKIGRFVPPGPEEMGLSQASITSSIVGRHIAW